MACAIRGIRLNIGAQIIFEWKMFYQGIKKAFFLLELIIAVCKRVGVPLFDGYEVIPMDPPLYHLLVWYVSTSTIKRTKIYKDSGSRAVLVSEDENPLSDARV